MIIDAFTFFNELDILEARVKYLWDAVDYFVLVESNISHSGVQKEMIFEKNKDRFEKYLSKIIYHPFIFDNSSKQLNFTLDDTSDDSAFWTIEKMQRNHIATALTSFNRDDVILIGDVDEIPCVEAFPLIKQTLLSNSEWSIAFSQEYFTFDLMHMSVIEMWMGTCATVVANVLEKSPQWVRDNRWGGNTICKLNFGGWHLSYFGDISGIITKLENFAHQENNTPIIKDAYSIYKRYIENTDVLGRLDRKTGIVDKSHFPLNFVNAFEKLFSFNLEFSKGNLLPGEPDDKISIIVPTMWKYNKFVEFLEDLAEVPSVGEIIIINNAINDTPKSSVLSHPKIRVINFKQNIFVNPAWNIGANICKYSKMCVMNDDVVFDTKVFSRANKFLKPGVLLGLNGSGPRQIPVTDGMIHFEKTESFFYGLGVMFFICKEDWVDIPPGILVGLGDLWLIKIFQKKQQPIYLISNLFFYTPWSITVRTFDVQTAEKQAEYENKLFNVELLNYFQSLGI